MKLTTQAYCKMLLHGAKYPHCAVNGLLVAERPPGAPRRDQPASPSLFVDCIPLFHGTLALAPMLEVALTLIDSWCKENSYVIAGYYQANERVKDASQNVTVQITQLTCTFCSSPNQVAEKVASRIAEGFNETALIMVDNAKFSMECLEPAIHVYELHENKWRCKDPHIAEEVVVVIFFVMTFNSRFIFRPSDFCEDWTEAQRIAASLLDSKSYETLVDFDNHLDDIRNDWTNPEINKAVLHLC
ncbi:Emc8 [Columba guinea]|nr:Emc8 [Columba guinea]